MSHDSHSRQSDYDNYLQKNVDIVRHLIGDVYESFTFLSTPEIQFALDQNKDNVYRAAVDCCKAIAARVARNTDYRFSTLWQTSSQAYKHFMDLAEQLDKQAANKATLSGIKIPFGESDSVFKVGMFDAPGTNQEHGDA